MPEPLHPAVVHFPIAIAVLSPLFALLAVVAIRRGAVPARAWWGIVVLQLVLAASALTAVETGEEEEDRVEKVVAERHIEDHEEAAERFLGVAIAALFVSAAGLLPARAGAAGRVASLVFSLVVLAASVPVGHSGGELVYVHGAGSAYDSAAPGPRPGDRD